ncbi:MAG: acyl-CoA dehydrogenase family protein [Spirochaetaceae bacterium]|nr:acyl-CoA dehydrogenase family protein [Myxococcales bacterium]MCB9722734.1 acyl-CoA dehydrogenase family protein [Spirochaetaceae bacterium]HPG26405.1 acyl-CoA dehydrogenase family protein [Myxococcota bacterium]
MDARFTEEDEAFRREIAGWLEAHLRGEFEVVRGRGGPGDEHALFEERHAWERLLGAHGWIGVGWPKAVGGRGLSLTQQMIFHEEYARAGGPGRVGHIGEGLLAPTVIHFGTDDQKKRFLPKILSGDEVWCQGYSEPGAGSDLASVQTRAELSGDEWIVNGQKVWTSGAEWSDWCFVVCRTDPAAQPKHRGISYLLVPMDQPGVEVRPIVQMTGDSEFSETFFNDARTAKDNIVGAVNGGWAVAMGTLAFERGASTLGQQMLFQNELDEIVAIAKRNGKAKDPLVRQRIAKAWSGLRIQRYHALRTLAGVDEGAEPPPAASISKLFWASWHRDLGKLAMDVMGPEAEIAEGEPYDLGRLQRMFLFTRSDTIYAGSNQIQRNIISERVLGMPREPR